MPVSPKLMRKRHLHRPQTNQIVDVFTPLGISAGTCVGFATDATSQPYSNEGGAIFALTTICWPLMWYVVKTYATDTQYFKEENVVVPIHVRKEMGFLEHTNGEELSFPDIQTNDPEMASHRGEKVKEQK